MDNIKAIFVSSGHVNQPDWAKQVEWDITYYERDFNKEIAEDLYQGLFETIWTRVNIYKIWIDEELTIEQKAEWINNICKENWYNTENSIAIEVHCNKWGWTWVEALCYTEHKESINVVWTLLEYTSKEVWLRNRGMKDWSDYKFVKLTKPLACVFECWFMDTVEDMSLLINDIEVFWYWLAEWFISLVWEEPKTESKYKEIRENVLKETWFTAIFDKHEWNNPLTEAETKDLMEIGFARFAERLYK